MSTLEYRDRPGRSVAEAFWRELVGPLLARELPGLRYAAARLGSGSDILGLDDATSRDHDWGCRLTVLVDEADRAVIAPTIELLERLLPDDFHGLPIRFPVTWDRTVSHNVDIGTVRGFAISRLGLDPLAGLSAVDWLVLTGQSVLEVTAGPVFADDTAELGPLRQALTWYPSDVERYLLAARWTRLSQRLPLAGRTGQTGQPVQSRLLAGSVVTDLIGLAFLLHRQWLPYAKWREAMFARLPGADQLTILFGQTIGAESVGERESAAVEAIEFLAQLQRDRGLPTPGDVVEPFWNRDYRSVSQRVPADLLAGITDPRLARLAVMAGGLEQWVDIEQVLLEAPQRVALAAVYQAWLAP
jgi:hypothetical protein